MALFSKRHYLALARFAADNMNDAMREDLADFLSKDNPQFNRDRFLTQCGLYGLQSAVKQMSEALP